MLKFFEDPVSGIRDRDSSDPGSGMEKSRIRDPGSATLRARLFGSKIDLVMHVFHISQVL